ncbi:MAG: DUF1638 domain-containing protein [Methanomassiliicoccales archaeon]|jgi:hypothetical protein|nr:DUF1638 domain-containing protein [Methanomassiliicoccales archaeon]
MTQANGSLRVGIIACEILKREIELMTKDDPDIVHREYLEFALHVDSAFLKATVKDKVNALKGKVDAVFLGYAICQSLRDVDKEVSIPTSMLESDDCIGAFITPLEYEKEKRKCTGTWFSSPGWAELGVEGAIKELHLDSMKDQGYDPMYFMKMLFEGYSRCLYIYTGVEDEGHYTAKSEDFAKSLNLRHECRSCDMRVLERALSRAKDLARSARESGESCAKGNSEAVA